MKMVHIILGSVFMTLVFGIAGRHSQPAAAQESGGSPTPAVTLIQETLKKAQHRQHAAEKVSLLAPVARRVLELTPANEFVQELLTRAVQTSTTLKDDQKAAKALRSALQVAQEILAFKPVMEAPLPEGFPKPTPVGEIRVQRYPAYRLARVATSGGEATAFWTLFGHIKKNNIAMTAPVEMTYSAGKDKELQRADMAFLYQNLRQGKTGKKDKVVVTDVPAMTAVSIGLKGNIGTKQIADAKARLQSWLRQHADQYEASGPLRVLGYNSPFLAASRRFTEVQIPISKKQK